MDELKKYIEQLINEQSKTDKDFAALLAKKGKSIEQCAAYLIDEAFKQTDKQEMHDNCKMVGWSDRTMLNHIIHYYQEDDITPEPLPTNVTTTPPQQPKPTPASTVTMTPKTGAKKAKAKKEPKSKELSLFDF